MNYIRKSPFWKPSEILYRVYSNSGKGILVMNYIRKSPFWKSSEMLYRVYSNYGKGILVMNYIRKSRFWKPGENIYLNTTTLTRKRAVSTVAAIAWLAVQNKLVLTSICSRVLIRLIVFAQPLLATCCHANFIKSCGGGWSYLDEWWDFARYKFVSP